MTRMILATLAASVALPIVGTTFAQAAMPNLICQLQRQTRIDPSTFAGTMSTPSETYRITDGKLYISSPDRAEYFYNDVRETEAGRYSSGHKTLIFVGAVSAGAGRMLAFHADYAGFQPA